MNEDTKPTDHKAGQPSAAATGYAPSVEELRTAARVIRWATLISKKMQAEDPLPKRWWMAIFGCDDANEMLRKSALLEAAADEREAHSDEVRRGGLDR